MKCVNCGSVIPKTKPDYDVPSNDVWSRPIDPIVLTSIEIDFGVSCDDCKKNKKIANRLVRYIKNLKKESNVGTWYLNEFQKILGEAK